MGQLPDHPNHPKGRNPYAHVAICVKSKFNASYKDIPDEKYEVFALYQLCTLFVSWNATKEKMIREIIDIRKSLFFR